MKLSDFDFNLPDAAIALRPAMPRDSARLLEVVQSGHIDHHVSDLPNLLNPGDVLVINETRVFPAALKAIRKARPVGGGGDVTIHVNLHKPESPDLWRAFVKPAKRLRLEDELIFSERLRGIVEDKEQGGDIAIRFNQSGAALMCEFQVIGQPPLPPYIARQRAVDARDKEDYQTVYAAETGSVAAPTAGLHFTDELMERLRGRGIMFASITLHVGAGTFLPVKTEKISDHKMHEEAFFIDKTAAGIINDAKQNGHRVIAVGTTSLRALESAARDGRVPATTGSTDIFITPGYRFKLVDGLMTNFHLPKSTLFMLVCALAGRAKMKSAYEYAIDTGYRFYSYGDSSLIWGKA